MEINKLEVKELIETSLSGSKRLHDEHIVQVQKWLDTYDGAKYNNEVAGQSEMIWKLAMKHLESLVPNIAKPFISSYKMIELSPLTKNDYHKAKVYEHLGNHFFAKDFDRDKFIKTIVRVAGKEGTAIVRVGWDNVVDEKKTVSEYMSPELQAQLEQSGAVVTQREDGKYDIIKTKILVNRPSAKVIKAENFYRDPTADSIEECKFMIHEYVVTLSDIRKQNKLYDEEAVKQLEKIIDSLDDHSEGTEIRPQNVDGYVFSNKTSKKVRIFEFFGEYDINGDGINEQVVAILAKAGGSDTEPVLMKIKENPFPFKRPPFVAIPLFDKEFSVEGLPLAHFLEDEQKLMTSIVRSVIDNMANSNSGVKFIRKKALDQTNYNRLINKERVVEVNTNEPMSSVMADGNFNELPSAVYQMFNMIDQHAESMTGISKFMQGVISGEVQASSSNFSAAMSQSQIRLMDVTNNLTVGLKTIITMWVEMCMAYLNNEEIEEITGIDLTQLKVKETNKLAAQFGIDQLPPDVQQKAMMLIMKEIDDMFDTKDFKFDVSIKVGTDGSRDVKIGQINMFLQQAAPLSQTGAVPPDVIKLLIAELAELLEKPNIADMIKNYEPQPDPVQQQMAQVEIAQGAAKAQKEEALAKNALARTTLTEVKAQEAASSIDAVVANKYADVYTKVEKGKTESVKAETDRISKQAKRQS